MYLLSTLLLLTGFGRNDSQAVNALVRSVKNMRRLRERVVLDVRDEFP